MPRIFQSARNGPDTPQTAPPPKKRMTLDAPMAQEKQPKQVNKQPMDVLMQMQDLVKTVDNNYSQFKEEVDRIQKHGTRNFMVTNEFSEKMKEICEKAGALNALIPESVNIHPIRKRMQLIIKNCPEVFTKDDFYVESTPIQLVGFKWFLEAKVEENGFLGLFLHAEPPDGFNGDYRIEVDYSFSIWNSLAGKDLVKGHIGQVYTDADNLFGYDLGCPEMAKLEDLLDPDKTFLTPEGHIETWVDFTIKSATLNHLA